MNGNKRRLDQSVQKLRSKNAGPFWLTLDVFCGSAAAFSHVRDALRSSDVAAAFGIGEEALKRFDIEDLMVIKFSLPRPAVQGTVADRDMHGASFAQILGAMEIAPPA